MKSSRAIARTALTAALLLALGAPALAESQFGVVDTQRILTEYKGAQSAQTQVETETEQYQHQVQQMESKLQAAQQAGKKPADIAEERANDEATLGPLKAKVEAHEEALRKKLLADVTSAIGTVAHQEHLSVVLNKEVVLYGGKDLTDAVLKLLNK